MEVPVKKSKKELIKAKSKVQAFKALKIILDSDIAAITGQMA